MLFRSTFLAALLVTATAAPALAVEAPAQLLGLWQDRIGVGVAYGDPPIARNLQFVDPVAAAPLSRRPATRAVQPAASKPLENQSLNETVKPPPVDLMAPRYSADVPLPHPDLEGYAAPASRLNRPQPYVRGSDQGAILGIRVPLSASRAPAASQPNPTSRSSGSLSGLDGGFSR
jgi:hypothetical protein